MQGSGCHARLPADTRPLSSTPRAALLRGTGGLLCNVLLRRCGTVATRDLLGGLVMHPSGLAPMRAWPGTVATRDILGGSESM
jgi:hypothetical protein